MNMIVKADAPGFIWLIIGIFWVVAQIAGAAAKKNKPRRPANSGRDGSSSPPVDPFAELLRKLGGEQPFEVPQPEYEELPEEPEPEPVFVSQNAWSRGDIEKLPDIEPLRNELRGQTDLPPTPIELPKIAIRPTMKAFRNTLPAMKLPVMSLNFQPLEKTGGTFPGIGTVIDPSDKKSLRRAMLSHIVFSKPKSLEP